eukprot:m.143483 g.143483  ORF g.143483 m.143483 type:complete len:80 (-) comp17699_c0_seq2:271-510(-)
MDTFAKAKTSSVFNDEELAIATVVNAVPEVHIGRLYVDFHDTATIDALRGRFRKYRQGNDEASSDASGPKSAGHQQPPE